MPLAFKISKLKKKNKQQTVLACIARWQIKLKQSKTEMHLESLNILGLNFYYCGLQSTNFYKSMKGWDIQVGEDLPTVTSKIVTSKSCIKSK